MNIYKKMTYGMLVLCVITSFYATARVRTVQTVREFDQQLNKSRILMVLFYDGIEKQNRKSRQDPMRNLLRIYEVVSSKKLYDDADIIFTKINTKMSAFNSLLQRYTIDHTPCFMILIQGKPVTDNTGKVAHLTDFVSEAEVHSFIQQYCMDDIKQLVQEKESNRKERFVKSQEESDPYFYPAVYYAPEYDFSWQKPLKYDSQGNEK